jgi:23S rRNA pseudouridine955/2504/2580 synthase
MRSFSVNQNDSGQRLDKFLAKAIRGLPTSLMYKYIRTKRIKVNGRRAQPQQALAPGDTVDMYIPDEFFGDAPSGEEYSRIRPRFRVAYEDAEYLIAEKEPGVLAHPGDPDEPGSSDIPVRETLIFQIRAYLYQRGEYDPASEHSFSPALCNRIDRNTGGLLIAAKNAAALRAMNEQIRLGAVRKTYLCAVHGAMPKTADTLEGYLRKDPVTRTVSVADRPGGEWKKILTAYRVLAYSAEHDLSLLEVDLLTGRTHQIRAHLASIGHPLLGDGKYGVLRGDRALGWTHQALYAYRIRFPEAAEGPLAALSGREVTAEKERIRFLELF